LLEKTDFLRADVVDNKIYVCPQAMIHSPKAILPDIGIGTTTDIPLINDFRHPMVLVRRLDLVVDTRARLPDKELSRAINADTLRPGRGRSH
jgi:hypothetical protein